LRNKITVSLRNGYSVIAPPIKYWTELAKRFGGLRGAAAGSKADEAGEAFAWRLPSGNSRLHPTGIYRKQGGKNASKTSNVQPEEQ
jgi:hypothetical protein